MVDGALLDRLFTIIESRRGADPETSRTARLFARGRLKIAQKVGEEAVETIVAALGESPERTIEESADLLYHLLVLWAEKGVEPADVWTELARRQRGRETMPYDPDNIFAKILRGEIPCNKVYEDDFALAFHDIAPQAPVHVLVIPKGAYRSMDDFHADAPDAEIAGFFRAVGNVARQLGVEEAGYRLLANHGAWGGQEVFHFHFHIFGGRNLGPMLSAP